MQEKENKKSRKMNSRKIAAELAIFGTLAASLIGGGAYAKYITSINGQGALNVAKWDVSYQQTALTRNAYDTKTVVVDKMAPGTEGSFTLTVSPANTEVGYNYVTKITKLDNKPANLYFTVDKDGVAGTEKIVTAEKLGEALSGHVDASSTKKADIKYVVHYHWDYETTTSADGARKTLADNDAQDTKDGQAAKQMAITYTTTATQVTPVASN